MTGQKRQLEKARQEKQAAKRERRQTRSAGDDVAEVVVDDRPQFDQEQVLADLADLHRRYDAEQLDLEAFEGARAELLQRLRVD